MKCVSLSALIQFYWEIDGRKIEHEDTFFYAFHLRKLYSYAQSKKEAFIRMEDAEDIYKGFSNIIWNGLQGISGIIRSSGD